MIHTDTFLKIGKTHQECEDYIISGDSPVKYIILSDGCSSSIRTEMGARILCHLAKQYLQYRISDYRFPYLDYDEMGAWIIHNAELTARQLGLNQSCLNATLIISYVFDNKYFIYMYGDGCIVLQTSDKKICVLEVEYTKNAPYYLAYMINPENKDLFHKLGQDMIIKEMRNGETTENKYAYDYGTKWVESVELFPRILIASDGLASFQKCIQPIDSNIIAKEFLEYKSTKGEFLKRRLKRAIKIYEGDDLHHMDDLSVGAFLSEEE